MTEVRFYHLTRLSVKQALPELLEKSLARGFRAVVRVANDHEIEPLSDYLWAHKVDRFLPHGSERDGQAEKQPIWITAQDERPNEAKALFLFPGAAGGDYQAYELVCDLFDGTSDKEREAARTRWKTYQSLGLPIAYWQQTANGWEKQG